MANDYGLIYIGTIVKAIIDLLSAQFGGLSASAIGNEILDRKIKEVISHYFATQTLKKCPNCQSENRDDAKYCDSCGHKFVWLVKATDALRQQSDRTWHIQNNPWGTEL